jgi:hypothetical protein
MKICKAAMHRARRLFSVTIITMVAIWLPSRSTSQAAHTTSQIKKPLIYQVGNVVRINAEGPLSLLRALNALQEKYGWIVDYEDPQYPADLDLGANPQSRPWRRHPNARNVREGGFSVQLNTGPALDSRPDEESVLTIVVDGYNQSNGVGQFELRKEQDGRFEVVGTGVRGEGDEVSNQTPILDLRITLTTKRRSADETIAVICQEVSKQSKIPVTPGGIAGSLRERKVVGVGGTEVSARTLLARTLASMRIRLSWRLLYDSSGKSYELTVLGLPQ